MKKRTQEVKTVKVSDLTQNPMNFNLHPIEQRGAFAEAVNELGFFGYQDVYEDPDEPGKYILVDGAMRLDYLTEQLGPDGTIDVNVVDFDENEAKKALATKDPISKMAIADEEILSALIEEVEVETDGFQELLDGLAKEQAVEVPFEPNLSPTVAMDEVTAEDVEQAKAEQDEKFANPKVSEREVMCPHCAETFYIKD